MDIGSIGGFQLSVEPGLDRSCICKQGRKTNIRVIQPFTKEMFVGGLGISMFF